jgi:hypothetical protein
MLTMSWLAIPSQILFLVSSVAAVSSPLVAHVVRDIEMLETPQIRSLELSPVRYLEKRNTSTTLGTVSLASNFNNDVLFSL